MSVINTNISGLIGLNNLRLTGLGLQTSLARLSSGLRINNASDDPSGLAIAKGMEAQVGSIRTAVHNAEDGISMLRTADGALSETQDILLRMRDLAVRAANEAPLTAADRDKLNDEFVALKAEVKRKAAAVTFNTKVLLSGGISNQVLQIGPDNGTNFRLTIDIDSMTASGLRISGTTVSTVANAQSAILEIQSALNMVNNARASLGVQEIRLNHMIDDLKAQDINISAAKSRIMDADMAVEISEFTRLQILQQSGTAILAQANAMPQSILKLMQ